MAQAMAQKCGNCHINWIKNNNPGMKPKCPVCAIAPNIGGSAPGNAPTKTAHEVRLLSGV